MKELTYSSEGGLEQDALRLAADKHFSDLMKPSAENEAARKKEITDVLRQQKGVDPTSDEVQQMLEKMKNTRGGVSRL